MALLMGRAVPDRLATGPALNRADAQTDLKTEAAMSCSCKWLILVREVWSARIVRARESTRIRGEPFGPLV